MKRHFGHLLTCVAMAALFSALCATRSQASWPADSTTGLAICSSQGQQQSPKMISDLAGGALIVWSDQRAGNSDIYCQHVLSSGDVDSRWPAGGRAICTMAGDQLNPSIASDGQGGAFLAWQDLRGAGGADIYATHVFGNGKLDSAWASGGNSVCLAGGTQSVPVLAEDHQGGVFVVWQDQRGGAGNDDIYFQHVLPNGAIESGLPVDGGPLCVALGIQQRPRAIADGMGGALVAWQDQRSGSTNDDIYLGRIANQNGVDLAWPSNGCAVCVASNPQLGPELASDGAGGAVLTWYDQRSGVANGDIYAAHVGATGVVDPIWPSDGRALCTAPGVQQFPVIVPDGFKGAIVAWQDARLAVADIYAMRVGSTGALDSRWPANGALICGAANNQTNPAIVSDGRGGAIIAWTDFRNNPTSGDIYVQHVGEDGLVGVGWSAGGVAMSTAPGSQVVPRMIADGAGGAIGVWTDGRSGSTNNDIYAARVSAAGTLGGTVVGVGKAAPSRFGLKFVGANPTRDTHLVYQCDLLNGGDALLEIVDVSGRAIVRKSVSGAPVRRNIELEIPRDTMRGLYFARLKQMGRSLCTKLVLD